MTDPTIYDKLQAVEDGVPPLLPEYDAVYYLTHSAAIATACGSDSGAADALALLTASFAGLRNKGFSLPTSPSSAIAEPIVITGIPDDPPSGHDRGAGSP